ncbi:LOW QUALITY PROTEIN: uncharacterized protein LOC116685831 [Etheostoma spectabile]|uniref:LOW QUALITY PROTEIN: uncharacterized protein LOC116685831 n=1 Tax=Etheostoma spectabile TaxID=54343 RepID=UPI0013AEA21D|nr:LOW QUALITY PROTEIN: uncharacterized protein LOC116685831 [Etheostoma spectabile]
MSLASSLHDPCRPPAGDFTDYSGYDLRSSTEYRYRWLRPVLWDTGVLLPCCRPVRISQRGCVPGNLRSLSRFSLQADRCSVHTALINVRSLTNKTFILNDFFTTHDLDFLLLTETWLKPGENSAFSELLPPGCSFVSTPRAAGRGGGLAAIFKDSFRCRTITANNFSSFELQLFVINLTCPVLCALVYRPPRSNKDFLQEFSEFCLSFSQISLTEIVDTAISDHLPVVFDFAAPLPPNKPVSPACRRRIFTPSTAGEFAAAFRNSQPPDDCGLTAVLERFETISLLSFTKVVSGMKPTNCPLDIIPAKFLKEVLSSIGSSLLVFINTCLSSGSVPAAFKHALVRPLIKKPHLDPSVLSNFRPVSHLPFLSKVLEKVVFIQLQTFLEINSILDKFQSGFRSRHSTESALLKVHNDIALSVDAGNPAVLVLLDLTAAFDTVDHAVLVSRLEHVGICGTALQWFRSYLANRSFSVAIGDHCSSKASLPCGVPQGSILGPILFSMYMLPLGSIIKKHNLSFHFYADDLQIYLPIKPNENTALTKLLDCITDIKQWLSQNFLHLNDSKTECILFGSPSMSNVLTTISGTLAPLFKSHVKNLGVTFDNGLKFDKQISSVVSASFFQLRLLAKVQSFLSRQDLEKAIHAFISSRLDYCNALYVGLSQSSISRLQLVQNAAARFLTSTSRREHITPVLSSLHWLPVRFRIDFKLLLFVFNAIYGLAPSYLTEILTVRDCGRALRSSGQCLLEVPRSRLKQWGDCSFAVAAPRLWNKLPPDIRTTTDLSLFKTKLKTHFFKLAFNSH